METILATISKIYYQFKKLNKENSAWKQISLKPKKKNGIANLWSHYIYRHPSTVETLACAFPNSTIS